MRVKSKTRERQKETPLINQCALQVTARRETVWGLLKAREAKPERDTEKELGSRNNSAVSYAAS